jgi:hypothetical protein
MTRSASARLTFRRTNESLAKQEVMEEYKSGVRECRACGTPLQVINNCNWTQCLTCGRACCFLCGAVMSSWNRNCTAHKCEPKHLIEWEVSRRTRNEPTSGNELGQNTVSRRPPEQINVMLTTYNGTQINFVVGINDTIDQFKQWIAQRTGISESQQLLSYSGKNLENGMKIGHYNIRNMSTVLLVTRVIGG